ncbi:ParA family protein (plasmid) [Methylomarinum sp. Ch1-1]|uniref:ParA family protein n=1 Tax=Methylomarinum roseum TaxID=3067653 RepID=A0AAU7P054_9GAMM|nr:ParA family protein [Methylomarinum sp. Ch1-1]MDP4523223.1 ParA family protein [Methylomarinum sp. Ch1-1]
MSQKKHARTLTIANNKGGTGKSFTTMLLADYAARQKMKVLVIDLDPQTNLSRRFVEMDYINTDKTYEFVPPIHPEWDPNDSEWTSGRSSAADIWISDFPVVYPTKRHESIEILPGHSADLQKVEMVTQSDVFTKVLNRLYKFVRLEGVIDAYDLILIDTRPSKGPLTSAALFSSSNVVIPSEMEVPSIEGLLSMFGLVQSLNGSRPKNDQLKISGILPNKFRKQTIIHKEHLHELSRDPKLKSYILPYYLSDRVGYKESMIVEADSIFDLPPKNPLRLEATKVCKEIFKRVFG